MNICKINNKFYNNILTFSGEKLPVVGSIDLNLDYKNVKYFTKFYVLQMQCKNVIGLELAIQMNLVKTVNALNIDSVFEKYEEVFNGLGQLKNERHLKVLENSEPIVEAPRRVPIGLFEPLKQELRRMENLNVIVKEVEPTEWVNSIVLVTKSNGSLRLCLDPRNLNKVIVRPRFSFPNIDECRAQLTNSRYFSSLDANSGFWMIPLDKASSRLCTFNTPMGRYRFLRLPFGINAAPEIFHSEMVRLFGDIDGLIIYMDDFLIHAENLEKHNKILERVLNRAKNVGLKFNKSKSKILKSEIKFIGHIFNSEGVKPDTDKIKAILKLPIPVNVSELQRFLGIVNYLGSFVENKIFQLNLKI